MCLFLPIFNLKESFSTYGKTISTYGKIVSIYGKEFYLQIYFLCTMNKYIETMKKNHKVMICGLLPEAELVFDVETVRMFSTFCENTCSNLFAFSPFQLHLEREEFLHFQYLADELKSLLDEADTRYETYSSLCRELHSVYCTMMNSCWEAFVRNPDIHSDPGKFIVLQLVLVDEYDKTVRFYKNGF